MTQAISNKSQAARTRQQQHFYSLLKPFWVLYSKATKADKVKCEHKALCEMLFVRSTFLINLFQMPTIATY